MSELLLAVLASGGLGAILTAVVAGMFSKRKLGAEATEIITKAAAGVVTSLQGEVERQEEAMKKMAAAHARDHEEIRRVLQLHVAWDVIAIAHLKDLGVTMPPAPPLLPPSKFTDADGYPLS